ncbi:MAG: FHA domain-containing protein [Candidatus Ratteibacteria bacterium]|jgi:pSer/pThr/pTyr-binding forkhead associated (FHA) protein
MARLLFNLPFMRKEYLLEEETSVGRLPGNTLTIPDYELFSLLSRELQQEHYKTLKKVSRKHAKISIRSEEAYIVDIGNSGSGSTFGTFVNKNRLMPGEKCFLQDGDSIVFGFIEAIFKEH